MGNLLPLRATLQPNIHFYFLGGDAESVRRGFKKKSPAIDSVAGLFGDRLRHPFNKTITAFG
jgi:hypothetical protein